MFRYLEKVMENFSPHCCNGHIYGNIRGNLRKHEEKATQNFTSLSKSICSVISSIIFMFNVHVVCRWRRRMNWLIPFPVLFRSVRLHRCVLHRHYVASLFIPLDHQCMFLPLHISNSMEALLILLRLFVSRVCTLPCVVLALLRKLQSNPAFFAAITLSRNTSAMSSLPLSYTCLYLEAVFAI